MELGDSKTSIVGWQPLLDRRLWGRIAPAVYHKNGGISGATVATYAGTIAATLANMPTAATSPIRVLINLGVNDFAALPVEATWEADYLTIIDAALVKWPTARIYLMLPWQLAQDANANTVATRIGHLIAARPGQVFAGPDERVWLKGSDNGTTNTSDGKHYSDAGHIAGAAAWAVVLGG